MPFPDNPTGGLFLIQPAIRSPNYVDGLVGWTINQDGTAQFFNVVIIGNDLKVLGSNGSVVELHSVGTVARVDVTPGGGNVSAGTIAGSNTPSNNPQLVLQSPQQTLTTPNDRAIFILQGANAATPASFGSLSADSIQLNGLAGTTGVGSAFLDLGNNQGSPAGVALGVSGGSNIGMDGGGFSIAGNITLATGSIDLFITALNLNSNRVYLLTNTDNFDCSATQALGGAFVAIPGMSHTYAGITAGSKWEAFVTIDGQLNATAGNVVRTQLVVAGVVQTNTLDQGPRVSTSDPATRSWSGTFAAGGSLSFAVNSAIVGGGGAGNNVLIGVSTLHVNIYQ